MIVRENINFERGLDPKKSMDIGEEAAKKIKIDKIKWAFDWKEDDYEVINFIEDYYGYPILLVYNSHKNSPFVATTTFDYTNNFMVRHSAYKAIEKMIETHAYYSENDLEESLDFERGIDPKKAAGVGLTAKRRFKNINEFIDYVITALPYIFGGKMPEDILSKKENGQIPESYFGQITKFLYDCGHEMPNGNDDWDGSVDLAPPDFHYWATPLVKKLEQILGEKRWSEYD